MGLRFLKERSAQNGTVAKQSSTPSIVTGVLDDIRARGDDAVRDYSKKFDNWTPEYFRLSDEQIKDIIARVPEQTIADIKTVQNNVRIFAEAQRKTISDVEVEVRPGVFLGHKNIPIGAVGA